MDAREAAAAQTQKDTSAFPIPPYNYGPVIAGQGTQALEFLDQARINCGLAAAA